MVPPFLEKIRNNHPPSGHPYTHRHPKSGVTVKKHPRDRSHHPASVVALAATSVQRHLCSEARKWFNFYNSVMSFSTSCASSRTSRDPILLVMDEISSCTAKERSGCLNSWRNTTNRGFLCVQFGQRHPFLYHRAMIALEFLDLGWIRK